MYSTLIVLDKPRHLRYTFGVISDFEQAIPGGFTNLFEMEVSGDTGFRVCRDILYAGIKWEDPTLTIPDTGTLLLPIDILAVWDKIFKALGYDGWISKRVKDEKPVSTSEFLDEVEKIAYGDLHLSPTELYALTPREFNLILEKYGDIENYRIGMICATIMNSVGGKKGGDAYQVSDFINIKKRVMSDEEIKNNLMMAFGVGDKDGS
jgi:hypothetical protein